MLKKKKKIFWRLDFLKLAVKCRDCRTTYSNTSFCLLGQGHKLRAVCDVDEPSMHARICKIDELTDWFRIVSIPCSQITSSNMIQCLFYKYSVSFNMKQRAADFYLVRSSSVAKVLTRKTRTIDMSIRPILTAYSILSFWVDLSRLISV